MFDALIRGGTVLDGTGRPGFTADVAIQGDRIAVIDDRVDGSAKRVVDARGHIVCPGFIDVHSHDDLAILNDREMSYKLTQGITTTIIGNCGHSIAPVPLNNELREGLRAYSEPVLGYWGPDESPFGYTTVSEYYDAIRAVPQSINVGALVGHGPLRTCVMGFSARTATKAEIGQMVSLLDEAMVAGALGLSLGLMYAPGCFADSNELVELARVVKSHHGIVTAHIRGEGDLLMPSIREMLDVAEMAKVSMHISHLKAVGRRNWGTVEQAIQLIREARSNGLDVTCDVYPYSAGSTTILSLLPPWVLQGGVDGMLVRLADPETRHRIRGELEHQGEGWENVAYITGWERVVLTSSPLLKQYEGMSIEEISRTLGSHTIETYLRIIEDSRGKGTIVIHHMDDGDVAKVLQFEYAAVGSDGLPSKVGHPHPRLYGTFPRFISKYVRKEGMLSPVDAIHKITAYPADRFKLGNRGIIARGANADIVIFDYDTFSDVATYENPKQFSQGLDYVMVNGKVVLDHGKLTHKYPGSFIKRTAPSESC